MVVGRRRFLSLRWQMIASLFLALVSLVVCGKGYAGDFLQNKAFESFLNEAVDKHGFDRMQLVALFSEVNQQDRIIELMSKPAEKTKTWAEYRPIFVNDLSLERGLAFWQKHEKVIQKAAQQYRVPEEIIVAIIGVETRYGRIKGSFRVIEALSTLAFSYPPRSKFFRSELLEFLKLGQEAGIDVSTTQGSYAGAMGYPQFIPSSYRNYAVDFDGDGRVDLIDSPEDAIGSVANYFHRHGWKQGQVVTRELSLKKPATSAITQLANQGLKPSVTVKKLKKLGFSGVETLPGNQEAALFQYIGAQGDEFWAGFDNFYVITRYNRSQLYAMAVYQLAETLRAAKTG